MTAESPAALIRRASERLRGQINKLTTDAGRWDEAFPSARMYADQSTYERLIMHPGIGVELADLLDHVAARCESKIGHGGKAEPVWSHERDALALARSILRETGESE